VNDPGALSAAVAQLTTTSGLGSYTLGMPIRDKLLIAAAYLDGETITYLVTDASGTSEVTTGVFTSPDSLTRDILVLSSTGSFIDWPASGQRIVTPLIRFPICDTIPTIGQVLAWDGTEWCPITLEDTNAIVCPTPPLDGQVLIWSDAENAYCPVDFCTLVAACLAPVVPPVRTYNIAMAGDAVGGGGSATTDPAPGPILSTFSVAYTIKQNIGIFVGNFNTQTRLIAFVYTECLPPPAALSAAPSVSTIVDDQGLVWTRRSAFTALLPASDPAVARSQNIRFETWWADCSSLTVDGTVVTATINLSSSSFVPAVNLFGVYNAGNWDPDTHLPASLISTTGNILPSFPITTFGSQSEVIIYYVTPTEANFVLASSTVALWPNPVFAGLFPTKSGAFFNLNQDNTFTININSAGLWTISGGGGSDTGVGSSTRFTFSSKTPPTWAQLGSVVSDRNQVTTDTAGAHFFICNQPGNRGVIEPVWDISAPGANTYESGSFLIWTYLGTSFFVAPFFTNFPPWDNSFIGADHFIPAGTRITDSAKTSVFVISVSSPVGARTGLTEPSWNIGSGQQTTDGTVTWNYVSAFSDTGGQELLIVIDAIDRN
jgi:hypothetical protein